MSENAIKHIAKWHVAIRVELLPAFKFTGKMVKNIEFTGKW